MTDEEKKRQNELEKQERIQARREELEKIKGLGFGARIQYFWDYYKIVLVIIAVVIFVIYLIFNVIQGLRTERLLYLCVLNSDELDADTESLKADYIEARGGLKGMQEITLDSSMYVNPYSNGTSQQDVASAVKITSYIGSGAMDAFLTPSYVTEFEQKSGIYMKMDDLLTEEEIKELGDNGCLYYASEPETDEEGALLIYSETESLTDTEAEAPDKSETVDMAGSEESDKSETANAAEADEPVKSEIVDAAEPDEPVKSETSGAAETETDAAADTQNALSAETEYALNTEPGDDRHIYAVRVDQAGVLGNYDIYADRQVWFSLIGNASHVEEAMNFLHFLLGEDAVIAEQ